jgi:peptidoglycan/LPS O-acetylase OafA/YrhL
LDPLRLIASLAVLLAHSVLFFRTGTWSVVIFPRVIGYLGYYGVVFFCVLSGFLITYLLLKEREATGKIAIGNFYMRRILRIWPLYYLIILLSFFVLPYLWPWKEYWLGDVSPGRKLLVYALFLPNLANVIGPNVVTCFQTYSIGYEEQFYLFWPFVMRMTKKYMMPFLVMLFFGNVLLEILQYELAKHILGQPGAHKAVRLYIPLVIMSYVPAFVAGAFAAMAYLNGGVGLLRCLSYRCFERPFLQKKRSFTPFDGRGSLEEVKTAG